VTDAPDPRPGLSGLEPAALAAWLDERGEPGYRARQIADAIWRSHAAVPADLRTLPLRLREALSEAFGSTHWSRPSFGRPTAGRP
jgi:adenine C2-methylase RlmN of 23S rRNA A2503 and tRNA A37